MASFTVVGFQYEPEEEDNDITDCDKCKLMPTEKDCLCSTEIDFNGKYYSFIFTCCRENINNSFQNKNIYNIRKEFHLKNSDRSL